MCDPSMIFQAVLGAGSLFLNKPKTPATPAAPAAAPKQSSATVKIGTGEAASDTSTDPNVQRTITNQRKSGTPLGGLGRSGLSL